MTASTYHLSFSLPGIWTWIDIGSESIEDAIDRLPPETRIDAIDFLARAIIAREGGTELLGVCTDLEGVPVDVQLELAHANIVPRADGEPRVPIETAAWAYRVYYGRPPELDDMFDGPNGLPVLRYQHSDAEAVSYVCTAPGDDEPVLVRISSHEPGSRDALSEMGDAILIMSSWIQNASGATPA